MLKGSKGEPLLKGVPRPHLQWLALLAPWISSIVDLGGALRPQMGRPILLAGGEHAQLIALLDVWETDRKTP